jgi:hypothetical protein
VHEDKIKECEGVVEDDVVKKIKGEENTQWPEAKTLKQGNED